ncbi:UNVERIFIED_CONTAM: hypothetical protein Slati_0482000 [Sesamum latifolium]|uniref:Uncharacterized protein n=1 Tax=Sesamum latifolium TaxID=2727402 RepID=A0AAW2XWP9_9LAMI
MPKQSKDLLWENFKLRYWWDNLTDEEMKKVWNENASDRFKEMMYKAKQKALNDAHKQLGREPDMRDIIDRGPYWLNNQLWNELVQKKNKGSGEFIDNKSRRISEEYLAKMGCTDVSSQSSFDLSTWYDVTGGPSKGRLYGFGSNSLSTSACSVSSTIKASEEKLNKLTKVVEDMRSNTTKMEEEFSRREEENRKLLETALEEARKREEEARNREADLQELVRKLLQDVKYTNHQFAGGSGQQEQQHSKENR